MEITIAWFWIIKLLLIALLTFTIYKTIKNKSKFFAAVTIILVIIFVFIPIKIGYSTTAYSTTQTHNIEQSKVLPDKVVNTSFKDSTDSLKQINTQDYK